jgi:hypothetical protein
VVSASREFLEPGHSLSGSLPYDRAMSTKQFNRQDVIDYMNRAGWGYGESLVIDRLLVTFSRSEWHGRRLQRPFTVSSWGHPDHVDRLVREAGREAIRVWNQFAGPVPQRFYDLARRQVVWDVRDPVAV